MTTDIAASAAAQTTRSSAASKTNTSSGLTSDFETFLKMLTAQARYQDPLEPIESTEYAAQLAQFSMVEQQVQSNDLLTALYQEIGLSNMAALASWVGMEARAAMPAQFDGAPISISPNPASLADRAELVVRDQSGAEIDRRQIAVSADLISWDGRLSDGSVAPHGIYGFDVESFTGDERILSEPAEVYGRITEAQARDGEVLLIFPGGQATVSSAVTGLRQPG